MESERNAAFAAWVDAEAAAYGAIHMLHQRTCGGRMEASSSDIENVALLRRDADARFAALQGTAGSARANVQTAPASRQRRAVQHLMRRSHVASDKTASADIRIDAKTVAPRRQAAAA